MGKRHIFERLDGSLPDSPGERWRMLFGLCPGRVYWRGMWRVDWRDFMLFIFIILLTTAYQIDTGACHEVVDEPVKFCRPVCSYLDSVPLGVVPINVSFNFSGG